MAKRMSDLISRREALDAICENCDTVEAVCPHYPCSRLVAVEKLSSAQPNAVPRTTYEQAMYERDIAIKQIAEIGKGLGEKMDDVERIVRCKDCISFRYDSEGNVTYCGPMGVRMEPEDFCSYGERKEEESKQ